MDRKDLIEKIRRTLLGDLRVCFAYLYGSCAREEAFRDIDIAVYMNKPEDPLAFASELKCLLAGVTGLAVDQFDVRVINDVLEKGDIFSLFVVREMLDNGVLLADNDFDRRAAFVERYGLKFMENQGLLQEVLV